jgi:cell division protein FtsW
MIGKIIDNRKGDPVIWMIIVALSVISLVEVYSSSRSLAHRFQGGNTEYYLFKHSFILVLALGITYLVHRINHLHFSRIAKFMMLFSILLMIYTLIFGEEINDARRWITIPVVNMSFQSSDFAKLALIMYTSRTVALNQGVIKSFQDGFMPVMVPIVIICGLIMFENMSTALILLATNLIIMVLGRVRMRYIFATIGLGIVGIMLVIGLSYLFLGGGRVETWKNRVNEYISADPENPEYQILHANIAIAKGGLVRFAPGKSTQSNFLPEAYSDFIFATIVEEFGLMGGAVIVFLYLLLLYRIIIIVRDSPKVFGALMALGLGMSIVIQAFINMSVAVNLLPVTGLTLPFVSMGGTSIWFNGFALGIILSVSRSLEEGQPVFKTSSSKDPVVELNV